MIGKIKEITQIQTDGSEKQITKLMCPHCGLWGEIDDEQLHGHVSVLCPQCGYHETHDFSHEAEHVAHGY